MARNYTFAEAIEIINAGTDTEAIVDIGRRYPALLHKITKVVTRAGEDFVDLMRYMPDYLTANKVNAAIKAGVATTDSVEETEETEDTNTVENETPAAPAVASAPEWNESMSAKQLWDILGNAGKRKVAKSTKKADLVEACRQVFGAPVTEEETPVEEITETTESNPYDGKSAMDLFKECKTRGIKAAPKKPAKYYVDLLVKADAEAAKADTESDDWGDEPAEETAEIKPTKTTKKAGKKAAKVEKPAADDDDDWDI